MTLKRREQAGEVYSVAIITVSQVNQQVTQGPLITPVGCINIRSVVMHVSL